jgi:hypothetical protein
VVSENLIDSNVFVRSLLLSLHSRLHFLPPSSPLPSPPPSPFPIPSTDQLGYLTHSWLDVVPTPLLPSPPSETLADKRPIDAWPEETQALRIGACHARAGEGSTAADYAPLRRLMSALEPSLVALLRDLMCVVDLRSVDHESICTINTATVTFIFLHRRYVSLTQVRTSASLKSREEGHQVKRSALTHQCPTNAQKLALDTRKILDLSSTKK